MSEEKNENFDVNENKVIKLNKKQINPNIPIADENGQCTLGDIVELYNWLHKISQLKLRSTVGYRVNVNMNKLKSPIKAYQEERDKYVKAHGIPNKMTGQPEIPTSDKDMNDEEKKVFYKLVAEFSAFVKELTDQKEDIPSNLRNFYINEEDSDFPEDSGVLPVHFKILMDFGLVHEGKDPNRPKKNPKQ